MQSSPASLAAGTPAAFGLLGCIACGSEPAEPVQRSHLSTHRYPAVSQHPAAAASTQRASAATARSGAQVGNSPNPARFTHPSPTLAYSSHAHSLLMYGTPVHRHIPRGNPLARVPPTPPAQTARSSELHDFVSFPFGRRPPSHGTTSRPRLDCPLARGLCMHR